MNKSFRYIESESNSLLVNTIYDIKGVEPGAHVFDVLNTNSRISHFNLDVIV